MARCTVQFFGFPQRIIDRREIELDLKEPATLADVVAALKETLPTLIGFAIAPEANRLREHFKFNLNGQLLYNEHLTAQVHNGDRMALLIPISGG
jgi:molybdopterin converting factor small subunit